MEFNCQQIVDIRYIGHYYVLQYNGDIGLIFINQVPMAHSPSVRWEVP